MKVKICGLCRMEDIAYVNTARPDYCGFVIDVPKSRRNIDEQTLRALRGALRDDMMAVGVFVDADIAQIAGLLNARILDIAQLHGCEDESYIRALRELTDKPIWQAFQMREPADVHRAAQSTADLILLDAGAGGGKPFDWSWLAGLRRPYILAGGINEENLSAAMRTAASILDVSSGAETNGKKDPEKMKRIVQKIKGE